MEILNDFAENVFKDLESREIKSQLQIHDIPYKVSVKNADIKFSIRTDMLRDFGNWDHADIDLQALAQNISNTSSLNSNVIVFFNNYERISELVLALKKYFDKVDILVWHKTNPRPQVRKRDFTTNHELFVYARRGDYAFNFPTHSESYSSQTHDENLSVLVTATAMGKDRLKVEKNGKKVTAHPTQKSTSLITRLIKILSNENDLVIDLYAGVLTTGLCCVRTNREFIVNDLSKDFVEIGKQWIYSEVENKNF